MNNNRNIRNNYIHERAIEREGEEKSARTTRNYFHIHHVLTNSEIQAALKRNTNSEIEIKTATRNQDAEYAR